MTRPLTTLLGRSKRSCIRPRLMTRAQTPKNVGVCVVGSGFAGLSAAIVSGETCQVAVIEKMSMPGGNSVYNAGQVAVAGSSHQARAGIEDSVELMVEDMLRAGQHMNHKPLLNTLAKQSNKTFEWTVEELGVLYRERVTQMGGHSVPRTLSTINSSGRDIIDPMVMLAHDSPNVSLHLNAQVSKILTSPAGRVTGVVVQMTDEHGHPEGDETEFMCSKGVVIASGGFGADVEFRERLNPVYGESVMTTNQEGSTAEVLKEALKLGAMPIHLAAIQLGPWTSPDEAGFGQAPLFCMGAGFPYGIIVDPTTSRRFVNELCTRAERVDAMLHKGYPVVCFTDSDGICHSLQKNCELLKPAVKEFATLRCLAREYNMDPDILKKEVETYNEGVSVGRDMYNKPLRKDVKPLTHPPFYACRLWPKVHHCMGGLQINDKAQVMHVDGHPIPGLYAAGEVCGGIHGADRLGSCATTECLAFGRIAGKNVASEASATHRMNDAKPTVVEI